MLGSRLLEVDDARVRVLGAARRLEAEPVGLEGALGRVLARPARARRPIPPFRSSAMDGFAVRSADLRGASPQQPVELRLAGESRAGRPAAGTVRTGQAVAISTGAVLPDGADAVLRLEEARAADGSVRALAAVQAGCHVREAGEDVPEGREVLAAGTVIGAAELGVLASLGQPEASCVRRPRLSLLVTGDELLAPGEPDRPGAVRDTSSWTVAALAARSGAELVRSGRAPDDPVATLQGLQRGLEEVEVAVVCGGVSVGRHDHVRPALAELGVQERFWGLALRPGAPTWFGLRGGTLVFGLPGNPVSAMVTFVLIVAPALRAMLGVAEPPRPEATLDEDYAKPAGRAHAVRCRLALREDGLHASTTGPQGSHVLSSMVGADGLAMIPSAATLARAGERVAVERLPRWGAP